jgi:hypothetical protein
MPRVGFEPMIPVFEQAKTFHTLDCTVTVIDHGHTTAPKLFGKMCYIIQNWCEILLYA